MRTWTLLALAGAAHPLLASLPHSSMAPLGKHLLEVNAQWAHMDPYTTDGERIVAFTDEAARIATHLRMVRERSIAREHASLSSSQRANRLWLLQRLGDYANEGLFPRNEVLPVRNPVFIDPYGTACAVGWLMIESGHRALAEAIQADMNLGYVHEIIVDPHLGAHVASWADEHGFTVDELAWIQPAYQPTVPWMQLGDGTNGPVRVLHPLNNGNLLVAGNFSEAGGSPAQGVAVWNGTDYLTLGGGVQGTVECAVEWNGLLLLGGSFDGGAADLALWDGSTWSYQPVFPGMYPAIHALHVHAGVLHAAGESSGFAGTDHQVKRLLNGSWEAVGSPMNGVIRTLATHLGDLIAGGDFDLLIHPTDPLLRFTARFEGTDWLEFGGGLDAPVHDLLSVQDTLYAAGRIANNILPTFGLAHIHPGVSQWSGLLPNHPSYISGPGPTWINALAAHGHDVYVGGMFDIYQMMSYGQHVAQYLGQPDMLSPMALLDGAVHALTVWNGRLVMGGDFALTHAHVASTDLSLSLRPLPTTDRSSQLFPVPAREVVTVIHPALGDHTGTIEILDLLGRPVHAPVQVRGERSELHTGRLATGRYQLRISGKDHHETLPLVVD